MMTHRERAAALAGRSLSWGELHGAFVAASNDELERRRAVEVDLADARRTNRALLLSIAELEQALTDLYNILGSEGAADAGQIERAREVLADCDFETAGQDEPARTPKAPNVLRENPDPLFQFFGKSQPGQRRIGREKERAI